MIYRFRIVLDVLDDVFRDIELRGEATLEDLHNAIVQAFGLEGNELASFYISDDDWNQGEEVVLFNMEEQGRSKKMNESILKKTLSKKQTKLIYVYDFLNMWTFYVELADIAEPKNGVDYPNLIFSQGVLPENPPDKNFEADGEFDDLEAPGFESLDDFDDQWN